VVGSNKRNDTNAKYGLGLQYEINPAMWVRGEVERYRVKNAVGQRNNVDVISVEGHTNRKGSAAYIQALSSERANSVKDYLVINGKLDPTKISAVGKGESAPVTQVKDCADTLPRAQLITCLQPDRRVEVEVTGAR
jgi:outer membrane protein OmpA-like peptidoglycan-associated protein